MRTRTLSLMVVLLLLGVACGAPRSGDFSPIELGRIPAPLIATTTTSTTTTLPSTTTTIEEASTTTALEPPPTTILNEYVRLFFIAGREQLVAIDLQLARPVSIAQVMSVLETGPTGDGAANLRSALPTNAPSRTIEDRGVVTVDLPVGFFGRIAEPDQRLAVAQIVLTLTQLGGISQVTFTQRRQPIAVVLSDGSLSDVGQALFEDDYDDLLDGGPVPESTSTTTTTTTTTTAAATTTTAAPTTSTPTTSAPTTAPTGTTTTGVTATSAASG